jgi:hypothetical protein
LMAGGEAGPATTMPRLAERRVQRVARHLLRAQSREFQRQQGASGGDVSELSGPGEAVDALSSPDVSHQLRALWWLWTNIDAAPGSLPDFKTVEWARMRGSAPGRAAVSRCVELLLLPAVRSTVLVSQLCAAVLPILVLMVGPTAVSTAQQAGVAALSNDWIRQLHAGQAESAALQHYSWRETPLCNALSSGGLGGGGLGGEHTEPDDNGGPELGQLEDLSLRPLCALLASSTSASIMRRDLAEHGLLPLPPRQSLHSRICVANLLTAQISRWSSPDGRTALQTAISARTRSDLLNVALSFVREICYGDGDEASAGGNPLLTVASLPPDWLRPLPTSLRLLGACRWLFPRNHPAQSKILAPAIEILRMGDALSSDEFEQVRFPAPMF